MKINVAKVRPDINKEDAFKSESGSYPYNLFYIDFIFTTNGEGVLNDVTKLTYPAFQNRKLNVIRVFEDNALGNDVVRVFGTVRDITDAAENFMITMDYDIEFMRLVRRAIKPTSAGPDADNKALLNYQEEY